MKNIRCFYILLLLEIILIVADEQDYDPQSFECPNYHVEDLTDPQTLTYIIDKTIRDFWNVEESELSKNGRKLKNSIMYMENTEVTLWETTALGVSAWIWIYLRQIDKNPNLCPLAKIINTTVTCLETENCDPLIEAIDSALGTLEHFGLSGLNIGLKNAGCRGRLSKKTSSNSQDCDGDGLTYDIENLWRLEGWKYPKEYSTTVSKLYKSDDRKDRLMALMATVHLSKPFAALAGGLSPEVKFEMFAISNGEKLPSEACCENLTDDAKTLANTFIPEATETVNYAKLLAMCYHPNHKEMCYLNTLNVGDVPTPRPFNIRY